MRNERGYALVLVLVIITITFIFAISMSGMALSARKQFNKTDGINKATDLAEMGVAHYEAWLANTVALANAQAESNADAAIKKNKGKPKLHPNGKEKKCNKNTIRCTFDYDEHFLKELKLRINAPNNSLLGYVDGNNKYELMDIFIVDDRIQADDTILVRFKSKGDTGKETKLLESTITINKNESSLVGEDRPSQQVYGEQVTTKINLKSQDKHLTFPNSTYFHQNIEIQGNRYIKVNGNAFFKNKILFSGTADIFVYGDAIFTFPPDFKGNAYSFCVYGNTYLIASNGKLVEYDLPQGKNKSCPRPQDDEWYINPDKGIEVDY